MPIKRFAERISGVMLAIVFMLAAIAKVIDPEKILNRIDSWPVVPANIVIPLSLAVIFIESWLSFTLFRGRHGRGVYCFAAALLMVFILVMLLEHIFSLSVANCSCLPGRWGEWDLGAQLVRNGGLACLAVIGALLRGENRGARDA
jgi:hypothetical protein